MKELSRFELPLHSLADGYHHYEFHIDESFFRAVDQDLIERGTFDVGVDLDKRSDLMVLHIQHQGTLDTACDRCTELIELPIKGKGEIVIKFVSEFRMDDDVTYLLKGTEKLDLAPFIFEVISLSMPLVNRYDCESDPSAPCNNQVLKILRGHHESETSNSPVWDELKKLNLES